MEKLIEIAKTLTELYDTRARTTLIQWQAERDIDRIKLSLTPPDGWPGKNEEQRRTAAEKTYAENDELQAAMVKHSAAFKALVELGAKIDGMETQRRAEEWSIRAQLVDVLRREGIEVKPMEDPFQAVMDQTVDDDLLPF